MLERNAATQSVDDFSQRPMRQRASGANRVAPAKKGVVDLMPNPRPLAYRLTPPHDQQPELDNGAKTKEGFRPQARQTVVRERSSVELVGLATVRTGEQGVHDARFSSETIDHGKVVTRRGLDHVTKRIMIQSMTVQQVFAPLPSFVELSNGGPELSFVSEELAVFQNFHADGNEARMAVDPDAVRADYRRDIEVRRTFLTIFRWGGVAMQNNSQ